MWGVHGVDEGVSVIFQDRTYIYFGDVAPNPQDPDYQSRLNLDLIAWTSEPQAAGLALLRQMQWPLLCAQQGVAARRAARTTPSAGRSSCRITCKGRRRQPVSRTGGIALTARGSYVHKGACPAAPGGGLRITPVLESGTPEKGQFYAFEGQPLVGVTKSLERPGGAFVWNGRVYVFANVYTKSSGQARPGNPQYGTYLLSTSTPDHSTPLTTHYLVSPRIGKCTLANGEIRSHQPLGIYFSVPRAPAGASTSWRRCKWCEGLFTLVSGNAGHCFGNPTGHSPYADSLTISEGAVDTADHQANWRHCAKCMMLFYNGYPSKYRCPAGGTHDLANSPS
jgi:hypothetical protein